jgi:hypothetical protein
MTPEGERLEAEVRFKINTPSPGCMLITMITRSLKAWTQQ